MSKPHIIFLMADQLRRDVLGCYGGRFDASPNIDALAESAVRFDAHATNCPLCVPARNALATGTWPHVNGAIVNAWDAAELPWGTSEGVETYYEQLADAGYRVDHAGVDHLRVNPPVDQRHDAIRRITPRAEHQAYLAGLGLEAPKDSYFRSPVVDYSAGQPVVVHYTNANTAPWPHGAEHFFDLWLADRLVEQIESADPARPLALGGMFWAPHCPLTAPEPYYSMFDPDDLELPDNVGVWTEGHSPIALYHLPGHLGATYTLEQWRKAWAVYLGLVRLLDDAIGRVVDALKRCGFWDDAVVVFTSDHGEMLGSHRLWQKMCMYEEAIRVPMLFKPPKGSKKGTGTVSAKHPPGRSGKRSPSPFSSRGQLTQHMDLGATFCDYAGVQPPSQNAGVSLRPIVEDANAAGHDAVFCEFNGNSGRSYQQRCVITPTHKYIHNHGWAPECYDLSADPGERVNLCEADAPPGEVDALRRRLADWMRNTNDYLEIEG